MFYHLHAVRLPVAPSRTRRTGRGLKWVRPPIIGAWEVYRYLNTAALTLNEHTVVLQLPQLLQA